MIRIDNENIDNILNILLGVNLDNTEKEDIKAVLLGDTMKPKGILKTIAAILGENIAKYIYIADKGTGKGVNDIYAINRGDPYRKTIMYYRGNYFWGSYGDIVENNIGSY